jgi:hypothetical protein
MAAFASHPKLQASHWRALFLVCKAYLFSDISIIFWRVYDMFIPLNIFMQIHLLASSHSYMHYINTLHHGKPDKDLSVIRLRGHHSQKLQKALPDKDLSTAGIMTIAFLKPSKISLLAYYMK